MSNVEERYARATGSSHLEVKRHEEAPGDADTIIAAGMSEPLGTLLARLKAEWDAQAGELALYQRAQAELLRKADAEAAKLKADPDYESQEDFYRREAMREAVTGRAMVLMGLRSLRGAKQAMLNFTLCKAEHMAVESDAIALAELVGKVMDVWLDRLCHFCGGVGFTGGYGTPRLMCVGKSKCGGSGSRRQGQLGENQAEQAFGLWLLNVMDSKCAGSMAQMAKKTRRA